MLKHAESFGLGGSRRQDRRPPFVPSSSTHLRPAHPGHVRHRSRHTLVAGRSAWRRWACARRFGALSFALVALSLCGTPNATAAPWAGTGPKPLSGSVICQVAATRPTAGRGAVPGGACRAQLLRPSINDNRWRVGSVAAFGDVRALGSPGRSGPDLVGIALAPDKHGYWAVAASGAVFAYGDAKLYGSAKHYDRAKPVAAIAATPTGLGYWVVSGHGGVFSFGDAHYYGSLGKTLLSTSVAGMAATPDGRGYWLVTAGGSVYTFGDARFYGSLATNYSQAPVKGIASTPSGRGYWLATASGHVYSFGSARYYGSMATTHNTLSAIASAAGGRGYWLLAANGTVHGYGAAPNFGGGRTVPGVSASGLASTADGAGYALVTTGRRQETNIVTIAGRFGRAGRRSEASVVLRPPTLKLLGNFLVTCYDLTGVTASGDQAGPQSVAVDPSVIPLGTQIYVQGIGMRRADDTGGAIIGDHVDIWEPTYYACANWGAQVRSVYQVRP